MTTTALLPAPAPCAEPACLHATPGLPCRCTCAGAGHGHTANEQRERAVTDNGAELLRRLAVAGGLITTNDEEW